MVACAGGSRALGVGPLVDAPKTPRPPRIYILTVYRITYRVYTGDSDLVALVNQQEIAEVVLTVIGCYSDTRAVRAREGRRDS